jgi:hypothetical protein
LDASAVFALEPVARHGVCLKTLYLRLGHENMVLEAVVRENRGPEIETAIQQERRLRLSLMNPNHCLNRSDPEQTLQRV